MPRCPYLWGFLILNKLKIVMDNYEVGEILKYLTHKELECLEAGNIYLSREIAEIKEYIFNFLDKA